MQQEEAPEPVLTDKDKMVKIQAYGRKIDAEFAFFVDDEFRHFYKPGNMSVRNCWLYMPILKKRRQEWANSFHYSLDQMMAFYTEMGLKPELIPIEPEAL